MARSEATSEEPADRATERLDNRARSLRGPRPQSEPSPQSATGASYQAAGLRRKYRCKTAPISANSPRAIEKAWLDPDFTTEKSLSLLKPFDEKLMFAEEVDRMLFKRSGQDDVEPTLF